MIDDDLNEIAETIANKSPWGPNTDNWTRIYQAARAGAVMADAAISGQRSDHDIAIGRHAFEAGFGEGEEWGGKDNYLRYNDTREGEIERGWSEYTPPEELFGGGTQ